MTQITFGEAVREARRVLHLTQKALAEKVGVSPQYLNDIELDRRVPAQTVRAALATHTKIDADYLDLLAGQLPFSMRRRNPRDVLALLRRKA